MRTLAALVEYDGTGLHGFQRQSAAREPTVQGELEAALVRITGDPVRVTGAGRTDRGVHASGQVISFRSEARLDEQAWQRALNAHLPAAIAVRAVRVVSERFDARRSATARSYRYSLVSAAARLPLRERYAWRVPRRLEVAAMDAAAGHLLGEHDFGAFGSSPHSTPGARASTVRVMRAARCQQVAEDAVACDFTANAFLTGMVRRLVGTLSLVGAGRMTVQRFAEILATAQPGHPGGSAPAHGLCLIGVEYPADLLQWAEATRHGEARGSGEQHESQDL